MMTKGVDLSLVAGIVKSQLRLVAKPVLQLSLPVAPASGSEARTQQAQEDFRGRGERILYVDDEEAMVFLAGRWLERLGYRVTGCTLAEKALEMFRSAPQDFDVVLSDLTMPQVSGIELARTLLQIRPGMLILITSGYIAPADNEEVRSLGLPGLVLKPNTIEELGQILHSALAACRPAAPAGQTRADSEPGRMRAAAGS